MRISQLQYYCNVISQISVLSKLKAHANSVFLIDYKSRAFISTFFLKIHLNQYVSTVVLICLLLFLLLTDLDGLCEFFEVKVRVYYHGSIQQNISMTAAYCTQLLHV